MAIELIILDLIDANPWQPRQSEDPEHIKKIALSIAEDGLLQTPVGRWAHPSGKPMPSAAGYEPDDFAALMIATGWHVQLAFGHSRLAAYKWIVDVQDHSNIEGDYSRSPFFGLGVHGHEGCGFGERMGRAPHGLSTSLMRKRGLNENQNAL